MAKAKKIPNDPAKDFDQVLSDRGYTNTGGGNNFVSWFDSTTDRTFYVFGSVRGNGPDDSHWTEVDGAENILAGGFDCESLSARLGIEAIDYNPLFIVVDVAKHRLTTEQETRLSPKHRDRNQTTITNLATLANTLMNLFHTAKIG